MPKAAGPYLLEASLMPDRMGNPTQYPFSLPVVRHLRTLPFHPKVTYLVGENGSGKSTLLEALAVAFGFNAEGGSRNFVFATRETHSTLHGALRLKKSPTRPRDGFFMRAETLYNLASHIDDLDAEPGGPPVRNSYGGNSLHAQSHGESFLKVFMNRLGGRGLYIFDEPEAALSPTSQMALLVRMHDLLAAGSQFVIATHSPIVMAYPDADIWRIAEDGLRRVTYDETEHVTVTRAFLLNTETQLRRLLREP